MDNLYHKFQSLNKQDKASFISKLDPSTFTQFRYFEDYLLRPNQIITPGNWRYWFFVAGRGSGKTKTGAVEIRKRVYQKEPGMMIVAATHEDLVKVMIPAIQDEFPPEHRPKYISGATKVLKCHNGIIIDCKSSQQGEVRGPNNTFIWLDELVKCWDGLPDKIMDQFRIMDASLRKGKAQMLITTTGNNWDIFRQFYDLSLSNSSSLCVWKSGSMFDNDYLAPQAKEALQLQYGNSRYAELELEGRINWDTEGALFTQAQLNKSRIESIELAANPPNPNNIKRFRDPMDLFQHFVIGVDPSTTATSTSDPWGIVVVGLGKDWKAYVLEDRSKIMLPQEAANTIKELHLKYKNANIIAESNQGGQMVSYIIKTVIPHIQPQLVHASQAKMTRAQPMTILWDQGRIHLIGKFEKLERELTTYNGDPKQKSPNAMDALVYALQFLQLERTYQHKTSNWMPTF